MSLIKRLFGEGTTGLRMEGALRADFSEQEKHPKKEMDRRLWVEFVVAGRRARSVFAKHGLQDAYKELCKRHDFDNKDMEAYEALHLRILRHFDNGTVPLEVDYAVQCHSCLMLVEQNFTSVDAKESFDRHEAMYYAIMLGRYSEALDIHLRDGHLLDGKRKSMHGLTHNNPRSVTDIERVAVTKLNKELSAQFPKPWPRYREIAARMNEGKKGSTEIKQSRVAYIIAGPRRGNKKHGKKK